MADVTVIDAAGCVAGRLATNLAKRLRKGEEIVVLNAEKAIMSGSTDYLIGEFEHRRDQGTQRKGPFYPRMPDQILKRVVRGMVNYQKPQGRAALKRLKVYIGVPDEFAKATPEIVTNAKRTPEKFLTLGAISQELGGRF
ncbi:MAG: 50S ribosomal protein L13 [Euryarchaeota archaeon]|nr:50S ribosomal protein L13 [Euryarchaeota archaeon]